MKARFRAATYGRPVSGKRRGSRCEPDAKTYRAFPDYRMSPAKVAPGLPMPQLGHAGATAGGSREFLHESGFHRSGHDGPQCRAQHPAGGLCHGRPRHSRRGDGGAGGKGRAGGSAPGRRARPLRCRGHHGVRAEGDRTGGARPAWLPVDQLPGQILDRPDDVQPEADARTGGRVFGQRRPSRRCAGHRFGGRGHTRRHADVRRRRGCGYRSRPAGYRGDGRGPPRRQARQWLCRQAGQQPAVEDPRRGHRRGDGHRQACRAGAGGVVGGDEGRSRRQFRLAARRAVDLCRALRPVIPDRSLPEGPWPDRGAAGGNRHAQRTDARHA